MGQTKKSKTKKSKTNLKRIHVSQVGIWSKCWPSTGFSKTTNLFKQNIETDDADFGILVHKIAELRLKSDTNKIDLDLTLDQERVLKQNENKVNEYVNFYIDRIRSDMRAMNNPTLYVEEKFIYRFDFGYELVGVLDAALVDKNEMKIYDLKTGYNEVKAKNNLQLELYANLLADFIGFKGEARGVIIQPSLRSLNFSDIELNPKIILSGLGGFIKKQLEKSTNLKTAKFNVGPHCRFCSVNSLCPSFKIELEKYLHPKFHDQTLDRKKLWSELLDVAAPIIKALEQIKKDALEAAKMGIEIENYELSAKNTRRYWGSSLSGEQIAKVLQLNRNDLVKESLETPTQIEKRLKTEEQREQFRNLVTQPQYLYLKRIEK